MGGRKIPDAKKYMETWCYEDRRKGFVYVEAYGRNDSNDIFYNLMPASWIRYIVEDINKEIKDIRGTVENEMENIKLYSKASIEFLKSKK